MKTFGWICLILGGLSFIGAGLAGNSVFGPCFWIALGITLIYFAKEKEKASQSKQTNSGAGNQHEKGNVVMNVNSTPNPTIPNPKTYWEKYKISKPNNAVEIESLGVCLANLSDENAKERIFSLETTAKDSCCKIGELKQKVFEHINSNYKEEEFLYLMEVYGKSAIDEAKKYNIKLENTFPIIVGEWILEKIKEIENRYSHLSPRSKKSGQELMMNFMLESEDENLLFRKLHIYASGFPMTESSLKYLKLIEELFDRHFANAIQPINNDFENESDKQFKLLLIKSKIYMTRKEIEQEYETLIDECNNYDVSFYVELGLAAERAERKFA